MENTPGHKRTTNTLSTSTPENKSPRTARRQTPQNVPEESEEFVKPIGQPQYKEDVDCKNNITLSDEQMYFYQLNVIHDIIHDYGAKQRWQKNVGRLKPFILGNNFTIFDDPSNEFNGDISDDDTDDVDDEDEQSGGMNTPPYSQDLTDAETSFTGSTIPQNRRVFDTTQNTEMSDLTASQSQLFSQSQSMPFSQIAPASPEIISPGASSEDTFSYLQTPPQPQPLPQSITDFIARGNIFSNGDNPELNIEIYNLLVKKINSEYVDFIKNTCIFNLFDYIQEEIKKSENNNVLNILTNNTVQQNQTLTSEPSSPSSISQESNNEMTSISSNENEDLIISEIYKLSYNIILSK
jgi:hypothetical protein